MKSISGGVAALALALTGGVITAGAAHAAVGTTPRVLINEVYGGGGNSGATYTNDFIELVNASPAPVDVTGWSVQYASSAGVTWQTTPLTGVIAPGAAYVVVEAAGAGGTTPVTGSATGTIPMSGTAGKVALVSSTTALACGGVECTALDPVVDFVGYGAAASGYAGSGPALGASNTQSVTRNATVTNTANNAADFTAATPTPGIAGSGPVDPTPVAATIAEVQGTGATSPLAGQTVTTDGVVTAAYPTGGFNGYVIQTPGTGGATDATPGASDAVFVFSSATAGAVAIGDHVQVTGVVSEFNGLTEITVAAAADLVDLPAADPVTPVSASWPTTDAAREALESMLFQPTGDLTITNTFSTNQYGEVGLAAGTLPLLQPTEVGRPGSAEALAAAADNAARGVVLDDGSSTNFLSAANSGLTPPYVSLANPVRVGAAATITAPVVVDFRNNVWKLNPTVPGPASVTFENDRTTAPTAVGGDLKVASFNVLNYFTTLGATTANCTSFKDRTGDPVTVNGGCDPRGAWDPDDLQRQQDKIVAAINALDADVVGLLEIENSARVDGVADEALGTLVDALNAAAGSDVWAFVPSSTELPPAAELDVITNALIYKTAAVERTGDSRALGDQSGDGQAFNNAREPIGQVFTPVGGGEPFFVAVNHFKSKGSAGPWPGDADTGDGQGASNESRVRQATALRDWVPTVQGSAESVALIGDFNAYTLEDPMQTLYDAGYTDVATALADGQFSYSFSGLSGSLDHVLLNGPAMERATGADIWEINAEESIALQYDRYNYHGTLFYESNAYRSSDHDPVLVGLVNGAAKPVNLTLLDINDFHGRIDNHTVKFAGTIEKERAAAEAAGDPVTFLSAGDNIGASLFASAVQDDQPTLDVLNALELSTSAVGNHEFDKGFADLTGRVAAASDWDYLGANVYLKGTTTPALEEYTILDMAGVSVGVIGAVTQETPSLVTPGGITTIDFGDPVDAVNRVAAQLSDGDESNGEADVLVAAYHDGAGAGTPDGSSLEEEVAAGGAFAEIVTETSAAVDAIFTGHTHKQYAWAAPVPGDPDATRPILQTGSYGEFIGKVVLTYDPSTDEVVSHTQTNVPRLVAPGVPGNTPAQNEAAFAAQLVATYPRVAEVNTIVTAALAYANEVGSVPVGSVTADITTAYAGGTYGPNGYTAAPTARDDRANESTLGGLVANALRETLAPENLGGAQIGVVNPGGLRADLFYAPDGVVTTAEANGVLPFVNNLWTTTLTGAQVKVMLEQQWQTNADGTIPSRPYLQLGLSDNVTYTYDNAAPAGSRVTSITVDGQPIDPAADYRIGTFSFLITGGDNFRVFTEGTGARDSGLIDRDGWISYLQANPDLAPDFARQAVGVPTVPSTVAAGDTLAFPVTKLDLTSLGSPQNTSLDVQLDGVSIGSAPVSGGNADVSVTIPAGTSGGAHTLTLVASPSGTTVTLPLTVEAGIPSSTTTLTASPSSQVYGSTSRVLLTATVESDERVTGSVEFVSGQTVLGTSTLRNGTATLRLPAGTPAGSYDVVARYAGTGTVAGSESAPVTVVVEKVTTTTGLSVTPGLWFLPSVAFVTVATNNGRVPSGTVEIREGTTVVKRLNVVLGIAIGTVPSGRHTYTATFVPNDTANVSPSTSAPVSTR
ncbi:ExeM/NucH family extracellular endonuclease [Cellulomonas terrae]|uniref:Multifunctional nuclease/2',3'-cyclic-nucleotide 2'-phosphodiesterase/5'-nucleotidase/3'-nucleotidase n=1 Tax=Cellulomonas terrae TaxID=311234 RepID=A0A511JNP3_9CELL|nr:ExeM/NucH family extracellular endonuclease [Cellulomonas terrae]GEL99650.1 multifunctional nuclease/2',3'-cyclic-nucleotide 2'-phosphodiesterase/5'-nucleotidase/3'-nucleotidase [Cellulomonas terrae]